MAASEAGKEMAGEATLASMLAKRDAANNILKLADLKARVIPGEETKTQVSVLQGRNTGTGRNFSMGVDNIHHAIRAQLLGPMANALKEAGILRAVSGGFFGGAPDRAFDLDVARELYRRDDPAAGKATGNKHAEAAAKIFGDVLDTARALQNKAGAFIGKADNYMGRQFHDMWKGRGDGTEAAFQAWHDTIAPKLKLDEMYPGLDAATVKSNLRDIWSALSTGVHDSVSAEHLGGFEGGANLGKRVSQDRSLLFNNADDWFHYNEKFGKGSVMDSIVSSADGAARDTALMQTFGTNPKAMYDRWTADMVEAAKARGDFASVDALRSKPNEALFDTVSGHAAIPGNNTIAYIGATMRNLMQLRLGSVIFPALTHLAIAPEVLRHNGINFWSGLGQAFGSLAGQSAAKREIANSLGAGIDGMMGHIIHRFRTEDGVPGAMANAVNVYHKLSGFTYYLDAIRTGMGLALSHNLAAHAEKEFGALDPLMAQTLQRYGIEAPEWDAARAGTQTAADGRNYLLPAHMEDPALQTKFQTYITDQIREGLNDPTPWARSATNLKSQSGTVTGEIVRGLVQFKSFTVTMMQRQLGRELKRSGVDFPGILYLGVGMTLAGYAGNALRDLASNTTPKNPIDPKTASSALQNAFVRGGISGILGDAVLANGGTSGGDLLKSIAGPGATLLADAAAGANSIREGSPNKTRGQIAANKLQGLAAEVTPNLWWAKGAYDYMFPYALRELADPGATQRHARLLRQQGQSFILPP